MNLLKATHQRSAILYHQTRLTCPWVGVMDQWLEVMIQQTVKSHLDLVLDGWLLLADKCPHPVVGLRRTSLALLALLVFLVLLMLLALLVWVALLAVLLPLAVLAVLGLLVELVELVVLALPVLGLFPQRVDSFPLEAAHSGLKVGLSGQLAHSVRSQDWWIRQAGRSSPSAPPYWNSKSPNESLNRMGKSVGMLQVGFGDEVLSRGRVFESSSRQGQRSSGWWLSEVITPGRTDGELEIIYSL